MTGCRSCRMHIQGWIQARCSSAVAHLLSDHVAGAATREILKSLNQVGIPSPFLHVHAQQYGHHFSPSICILSLLLLLLLLSPLSPSVLWGWEKLRRCSCPDPARLHGELSSAQDSGSSCHPSLCPPPPPGIYCQPRSRHRKGFSLPRGGQEQL